MAKEQPGSAYTTMSLRLAKVLKKTALEYLSAQEKILGRRLALNQLIVDALVEKLVSEGFLPAYLTDDPIVRRQSKPELGRVVAIDKD